MIIKAEYIIVTTIGPSMWPNQRGLALRNRSTKTERAWNMIICLHLFKANLHTISSLLSGRVFLALSSFRFGMSILKTLKRKFVIGCWGIWITKTMVSGADSCSKTGKVCHEKNFSNSGADISVSMHFTENLKVPAERPWKMQTFDMWYIFVGQMLLGLHESNWKNAYWKTCYFLQNCISQ